MLNYFHNSKLCSPFVVRASEYFVRLIRLLLGAYDLGSPGFPKLPSLKNQYQGDSIFSRFKGPSRSPRADERITADGQNLAPVGQWFILAFRGFDQLQPAQDPVHSQYGCG